MVNVGKYTTFGCFLFKHALHFMCNTSNVSRARQETQGGQGASDTDLAVLVGTPGSRFVTLAELGEIHGETRYP